MFLKALFLWQRSVDCIKRTHHQGIDAMKEDAKIWFGEEKQKSHFDKE